MLSSTFSVTPWLDVSIAGATVPSPLGSLWAVLLSAADLSAEAAAIATGAPATPPMSFAARSTSPWLTALVVALGALRGGADRKSAPIFCAASIEIGRGADTGF